MNSKEKHNINTVFAIVLSRVKQSGETTTLWHGIKGLYMVHISVTEWARKKADNVKAILSVFLRKARRREEKPTFWHILKSPSLTDILDNSGHRPS